MESRSLTHENLIVYKPLTPSPTLTKFKNIADGACECFTKFTPTKLPTYTVHVHVCTRVHWCTCSYQSTSYGIHFSEYIRHPTHVHVYTVCPNTCCSQYEYMNNICIPSKHAAHMSAQICTRTLYVHVTVEGIV